MTTTEHGVCPGCGGRNFLIRADIAGATMASCQCGHRWVPKPRRAVVVNFFAGPGAGKSTAKAGLFFLMKQRGFKVETVDEYAKEKTYEGGGLGMNQLYLTAKQDLRLRRLEHQVDFILSDSPLLISIAYADGIYGEGDYASLVTRLFDSYQNFNVWVRRAKHYQTYGRSQTEDEARALDRRLRKIAGERIHLEVDGDEHAPGKVLEALTRKHCWSD